MRQVLVELLGLGLLVMPVMAIKWNLAGQVRRRSSLLAPENHRLRWRLEIYSNDEDVVSVLVDPADVPFPVKRVRSIKAERANLEPDAAWTLPRIELDVEVSDPLTDDSLTGLLGTDHRVRFVTGNEAVVDTHSQRLRIRAFRFG